MPGIVSIYVCISHPYFDICYVKRITGSCQVDNDLDSYSSKKTVASKNKCNYIADITIIRSNYRPTNPGGPGIPAFPVAPLNPFRPRGP